MENDGWYKKNGSMNEEMGKGSRGNGLDPSQYLILKNVLTRICR